MTDATTSTDPQGDAGPAVVIERTLAAPIERVWSMWVDPTHFAAWYGPTGARIPTAEMDVVVGGRRLVCMEMDTPDGTMQMWFAGEYLVVDEPSRLVYTEAMADADGNVTPADEAGLPPGHPVVTTVTVELAAVDGGTVMVLTHVGIPADSPGAMGWNMALDDLEAQLA